MVKVLKWTGISLLVILALFLVFALVYFGISLYQVNALEDVDFPRLEIYTDGKAKIKSKEEYVDCTVTLTGAGEFDFSSAAAGIRGRGNSSWNYPKKPYRIKFDEKISVFGESKNKSWVLLAMFNDHSLTKDRLAFSMADALETDVFVPSYNYVELYLNGKYNGIYLLTDQVDENKGRTNVKSDFAPEATEVPFLVELDAYAELEGPEDEAFFRIGDALYTVKYPEADERYSDEQFAYVKNYITKLDELCRKPNVTLAELSEYMDVDSFIDYYIVEEVMGQMELNWKSVYMSKAEGEKLKMGPVWDFDWSVTGPHEDSKNRNMYKDDYSNLRSNGNWFASLLNNSAEFKLAVAERWKVARVKLLDCIDDVESDWESIKSVASRDWYRWHWYNIFSPKPEKRYMEVMDWCRGRIAWLDTAFEV